MASLVKPTVFVNNELAAGGLRVMPLVRRREKFETVGVCREDLSDAPYEMTVESERATRKQPFKLIHDLV